MTITGLASVRWVLLALTLTAAGAHGVTASDPKTAAAVVATDKAWGDAEETGDVQFVEQLLDDSYVSVGAKGKVTTKAAIVGSVGGSPEARMARAKKVAEWRAQHPGEQRSDVKIFGDTAVLTWLSQNKESAEPVHSCDIFVYRGGHWHAIYSQHTTGEG